MIYYKAAPLNPAKGTWTVIEVNDPLCEMGPIVLSSSGRSLRFKSRFAAEERAKSLAYRDLENAKIKWSQDERNPRRKQ